MALAIEHRIDLSGCQEFEPLLGRAQRFDQSADLFRARGDCGCRLSTHTPTVDRPNACSTVPVWLRVPMMRRDGDGESLTSAGVRKMPSASARFGSRNT